MGSLSPAMFLAMSILVTWKMPAVEHQLVQDLLRGASGEAVAQSEVDQAKADAARYGVNGSLVWAVWALYLKASVVSAVTLFISTFASSSLFTDRDRGHGGLHWSLPPTGYSTIGS